MASTQINYTQTTPTNAIKYTLSMWVKRSNTFFNIAMEIGEKGTTEDDLIKEQFIRFNFGVTFKGIWFVKRKYD